MPSTTQWIERKLPTLINGPLQYRLIPIAAAAVVMLALAGAGETTLSWTLLFAAILLTGEPDRTNDLLSRLPMALLAISALLISSPAAPALIVVSAVSGSVTARGRVRRAAPLPALVPLLFAGTFPALPVLLGFSLIGAVLPMKGEMGRAVFPVAGLLAGTVILGPPVSAERSPCPAERPTFEHAIFDWHADPVLDHSAPEMVFHHPYSRLRSLNILVNTVPGSGSHSLTLSSGDLVFELKAGMDTLVIPPSMDPIHLMLEGEWSPFCEVHTTLEAIWLD